MVLIPALIIQMDQINSPVCTSKQTTNTLFQLGKLKLNLVVRKLSQSMTHHLLPLSFKINTLLVLKNFLVLSFGKNIKIMRNEKAFLYQ